MKSLAPTLLILVALPAAAQVMDRHSSLSSGAAVANEHLGTVTFTVSCAAASHSSFNRGVALLHDFWYEEARSQFRRLIQSDPSCAMAHWGVAMSLFHQIWGRPNAEDSKLGWEEMQAAQSLNVASERERAYIGALADFYRPGTPDYPARISAYSAAMASLFARYPDDVDAGAFYALSLLAAKKPNDESVQQERRAMTVLVPLFAKYPDNPGIVHYIIHSCDNPAMAAEGLVAADHYGEIAPSGPHAFHMPGHIYARLGLWQKDIASQLGSIKASEEAEAHGESGIMDEGHSYDFVLYAYLQSGQDTRAKAVLEQSVAPLNKIESMPGMAAGRMAGMVPYYRTKLPIFYALETNDWQSAAAIEPVAGSPPEVSTLVYWARVIADGHLRQPQRARADLAQFEALMAELKNGSRAYLAEGTGPKIERSEMLAWTAFAEDKPDEALSHMRTAADLQDKVGQAEVDIPAREMLADMLLALGNAQKALAEYEIALKLSPNRLNGLSNAGRAAEAIGDKKKAEFYYLTLLKITSNGQDSTRPAVSRARSFLSSMQPASR